MHSNAGCMVGSFDWRRMRIVVQRKGWEFAKIIIASKGKIYKNPSKRCDGLTMFFILFLQAISARFASVPNKLKLNLIIFE
jgi:hypothetical protein